MLSNLRNLPITPFALAVAVLVPSVGFAQCQTQLQRFETVDSIQNYTVPATSTYWIEAAGALGGQGLFGSAPGRGAIVAGNFVLDAGTTLKIVAGGVGVDGNGGGGGSFVTTAANSPLLVAGGGGGNGTADNPQKDGQAGPNGGSSGAMSGGSAGNGGSSDWLGAGGGFFTNGSDGTALPDVGGRAFVNGAQGGGAGSTAAGGFGGGGRGTGYISGGGGGGYSGGGSTRDVAGGGGGSFNAGSEPSSQAGTNDGPGYVRICRSTLAGPVSSAAPVPVPTLSGWSMLILAGVLAGMEFIRLRRSV